MSIATYTFYLESEAGLAAEAMAPTIELMKIVPDGASLPAANIASHNSNLRNLGDGLYSVSIDWSEIETELSNWVDFSVFPETTKRSIFIKINTGFETQDQRYLTIRAERHDVLPELVDNLQSSADSLSTSAALLETTTSKILAIEEGSWVVANQMLLIFDKATLSENFSENTAIAKFDLLDQQGVATDTNPYSRIVKD